MRLPRLTRSDLMSLEQYSTARKDFRAKVIDHKRNRNLPLGPNATWSFEDQLTMQYQVQEMLRVERIFEAEGIQEELDAYNPLIPDGHNWKATMLIEYPEAEERRRMLAKLKGVERSTWVQVEGCERVAAIADEDLERENEEKTSSVHFLRFELDEKMREKLHRGAALAIGVEHPHYRASVTVPEEVRAALMADLQKH